MRMKKLTKVIFFLKYAFKIYNYLKLTVCHFDLEFIHIEKEMEAAFENLNHNSMV